MAQSPNIIHASCKYSDTNYSPCQEKQYIKVYNIIKGT